MNKTITYLGIEKVTYTFDKNDILKALLKTYGINVSVDYSFELYEDPEHAELIVNYKREEKNENKNSK